VDSEFERPVVIFQLEFPSMGFHFRRTVNTLPNLELGGEVDLAGILMGIIDDGGS